MVAIRGGLMGNGAPIASGTVIRCPFGWHPNADWEPVFWDPAVDPGDPHSYCTRTSDFILAAEIVVARERARAKARPRAFGRDTDGGAPWVVDVDGGGSSGGGGG